MRIGVPEVTRLGGLRELFSIGKVANIGGQHLAPVNQGE